MAIVEQRLVESGTGAGGQVGTECDYARGLVHSEQVGELLWRVAWRKQLDRHQRADDRVPELDCAGVACGRVIKLAARRDQRRCDRVAVGEQCPGQGSTRVVGRVYGCDELCGSAGQPIACCELRCRVEQCEQCLCDERPDDRISERDGGVFCVVVSRRQLGSKGRV